MAKITLAKGLASATYGGVDIALEERLPNPVAGPLFAADIERLVVVGGSAAVNLLEVETEYSEVLFYSALPLAEKTVYRLVKGRLGYSIPSASELGFRVVTQTGAPAPAPQQAASIVSY